MKKIIFAVLIFLLPLFLTACTTDTNQANQDTSNTISKTPEGVDKANKDNQTPSSMANPASVYCENQGGKVDIRNDPQGGQIGFCVFTDGSECDEWAFFRKECVKGDSLKLTPSDIEKDTKLIKQAMINEQHIDPSTEVTVSEDTGKYAAGGMMGAYIFAAKVNGSWTIVAAGNGQINCSQLTAYPDFPVKMIPECIDDETGNPISRTSAANITN